MTPPTPFHRRCFPTNFLRSSYTTTKLKRNPYYSPTNFRSDSCLVCNSRKRLCCQNINVAILIFNSMTIRMPRLYRFDASNDDMLMLCSTMVNFLTCISYYNINSGCPSYYITYIRLSVSIFDLSSSRYGWISITLWFFLKKVCNNVICIMLLLWLFVRDNDLDRDCFGIHRFHYDLYPFVFIINVTIQFRRWNFVWVNTVSYQFETVSLSYSLVVLVEILCAGKDLKHRGAV